MFLDYHAPVELKKPLPWSFDEKSKIALFLLFAPTRVYKKKTIYYDPWNFYQPLQGWRMIVHKTDELPSSSDFHFFIIYNAYQDLIIKTELLLIDDVLKGWSPKRRGCFLPGEKKLIFFKKFTKKNCEHECLSFRILKVCKCVPFYVIRKL